MRGFYLQVLNLSNIKIVRYLQGMAQWGEFCLFDFHFFFARLNSATDPIGCSNGGVNWTGMLDRD